MEDYNGAFVARFEDTEILIQGNRAAGAMHLGGMTVECLLKHMVVTYHGVRNWGETQSYLVLRSRTLGTTSGVRSI